MKLLPVFLALLAGVGCSKPKPGTVTMRHCDLVFAGPTSGEVCFDRTDGQGHKQAFTPADEAIVSAHLYSARPCTAGAIVQDTTSGKLYVCVNADAKHEWKVKR
jgi:hypothetical protein